MRVLLTLMLLLAAPLAFAADPLSIPAITLGTNAAGAQEYSVSLQILLIMTALSFIPAFVMLMTSFTRIIIVFSILRQALGLQQTPSNQILTGMALFLTLFIMAPVFDKVNQQALQPYLAETITAQVAIDKAQGPIKDFMLSQTRSSDLELFVRLSKRADIATPDQAPLTILVPAFVMLMTSFTRIIIVFSILRQALGLQQTPSNQILTGMALFLTLFIMAPVFDKVNQQALQPYLAEKMTAQDAIDKAQGPIKDFMLSQTRSSDLELFMRLSKRTDIATPDQAPLTILVPAFVTSELKTAFQIGFMIFIPFLIIDLVVASVLMAMGMMMLSPLIISLPFKIMLFVLVDGWALIIGTLASSFGGVSP